MTQVPVSHRPARAAAADTLVLPHTPWKGKLDWKLLLGWLRDDKLISADAGYGGLRILGVVLHTKGDGAEVAQSQ